MGLQDALNNFKKNNEKKDNIIRKDRVAIITANSASKKFSYTDEQQEIIESNADSLKVRAFSGAGKTSTLEGYSKRRSSKKGLYISFNTSIKEEAQKKFPSKVKCVTSHGLAYSKFGNIIQHKLMGYTDWKDVYDKTTIKKHFSESDIHNRMYVSLLLETINLYTNTDSIEIEIKHVVGKQYKIMYSNKAVNKYLPSPLEIKNDAILLWNAMIDPNIIEIRATHDVYLKQYQLTKPELKYDYILLDEAQDSNPALLDIFSRQKAGKILVGDPYQSIYGFRNAIDAMNQIDTEQTLDLTKSFRFGEQISEFANSILALRGETKQILGMKETDLVYYGKPLSSPNENLAYIARYNATLLHNCIEYINVDQSSKIYFAGGFNSLRPDLLLDLYNLKNNNASYIQDPMVSSFSDYEDFKEIMTKMEDVEWLGRAKLIEEYGQNLPNLLRGIKKQETSNASTAKMIFSTAHKSKGLEFDNVVLANDYYNSPISDGVMPKVLYNKQNQDINEEIHVLYVAATRAKKTLNISEEYRSYFLDFNKMLSGFEYNLTNKTYPFLNNNIDLCKKLIIERDKATVFYKQKRKNEESEGLSPDDLFD